MTREMFIYLFEMEEYSFSQDEMHWLVDSDMVIKLIPAGHASSFSKDYILEVQQRYFNIGLRIKWSPEYDEKYFQPYEVKPEEVTTVIPEHIEKHTEWRRVE